MIRTLLALTLLIVSSTMSAQVRADLGIAAGQQEYETGGLGTLFILSTELMLSRDRLALYYALDHCDLDSAGSMYASHFGAAYRWPFGRNAFLSAGAGPSYVSVEHLGGEPSWHAQIELALRTGRLEWFAKVRQYDYSLSEFRIANASPGGPALLAGLRIALRK